MSLQTKFTVKQVSDRLSVNFNELTNLYSQTNIGGYTSPNPATTDAISAKLLFTRNGDATTYTVDISSRFPSSDPNVQISIPYTSFGGAAGVKMPDDIWHIEYLVTFSAQSGFGSVSNDIYFAFTGGIKCCITTLRSSTPIPKSSFCSCGKVCKCEWKPIKCIAILGALYDSICPNVNCDQLNQAEAIIQYLTRYCQQNCQSC